MSLTEVVAALAEDLRRGAANLGAPGQQRRGQDAGRRHMAARRYTPRGWIASNQAGRFPTDRPVGSRPARPHLPNTSEHTEIWKIGSPGSADRLEMSQKHQQEQVHYRARQVH